MILRRLAQSLKEQNWTAITLEFVLLVVGVSLGIQAANWNAERVDSARTQGYLQRIADDLDADIANYQDRMDFWRRVTAYGGQALDYAETGDAKGASQWQLLLAFFQSSQVAEFYTTDATFEELKSAGELGLISDERLRKALADYYNNGANPALTERPAYRQHVRGVIPLAAQQYIWEHCYSSNARMIQKLVPCAAPQAEPRSAAVVDAIRADPALMAELRYWMSTLSVAARIGRDRTAHARELRAAIAARLGEPRIKATP
jgi:hypothetical protein